MASGSGYTTPVVTDATAATTEELHEAVRAFLPAEPEALTFKRASGACAPPGLRHPPLRPSAAGPPHIAASPWPRT